MRKVHYADYRCGTNARADRLSSQDTARVTCRKCRAVAGGSTPKTAEKPRELVISMQSVMSIIRARLEGRPWDTQGEVLVVGDPEEAWARVRVASHKLKDPVGGGFLEMEVEEVSPETRVIFRQWIPQAQWESL